MEFKPKNRDWVKNAAIIFLAVLLVLTFFSNTIMNRSLPEVATAGVTDGSIVAKVRGTREIRSVMVKVGQEVKTGDTLFVLGAGDSQELEAAKETLRDLQYAYQKSAVSMPSFNNTTELRAVETASKALDEADKAYSDAYTTYKTMEKELSNKDTLDKLSDAEDAMTKAYNTLISVQASYDQEYQRLSAEVVAWQERVNQLTEIPEPTPTPPPEEVTTTPGQDGDKKENGDTQGQGAEVLSASGSYTGYINLGAVQTYGSLKPEDVKDLATAKAWLASAQAALADFVASNKTTLENAQSVYDSAKAKYDALLKYNEQVNYQLVPYKEALDKAEAEMKTAEAAYEDACNNLYFTQSQNDKTLASASIDLQRHRNQGYHNMYHRGTGYGPHFVLLRHQRPGTAPAGG